MNWVYVSLVVLSANSGSGSLVRHGGTRGLILHDFTPTLLTELLCSLPVHIYCMHTINIAPLFLPFLSLCSLATTSRALGATIHVCSTAAALPGCGAERGPVVPCGVQLLECMPIPEALVRSVGVSL